MMKLLLRCMSPLLAHSVALNPSCRGLLVGAKRTAMLRSAVMRAFDPKRKRSVHRSSRDDVDFSGGL
jgi:hypothetical protein